MGRIAVDDLDLVEKVFDDLQKEFPGFVAELDNTCCHSCGHCDLSGRAEEYMFAHEQSMESAFPMEIEYESYYYDADGMQVDEYSDEIDYEECEERQIERDRFMRDALYLHHSITNPDIKEAIKKYFTKEGFVVDWDGSDDRAIKVLVSVTKH